MENKESKEIIERRKKIYKEIKDIYFEYLTINKKTELVFNVEDEDFVFNLLEEISELPKNTKNVFLLESLKNAICEALKIFLEMELEKMEVKKCTTD